MITCPTCRFAYDPAATGGGCPRCALTAALESVREPVAAADFEFIAELGRGAMGSVSLARQCSLDRLVALKVIAPGSRPADWLEARLLREARAAAQVAHPHIVTVHEVGAGPAGMFLAMEYCEGGDLRARLQEKPLAPRAAAALGVKLADAVARAHAAGVLHRDLKPSNILLTAAGEPKITDFGLSSATLGTGELTQPGQVAGSPSYLAPELLEADPKPGPAVDVYGLGAVLYECVTGRAPFTGDSAASVLAQVRWTEPVPPRALNPDVPRDLETIVLKCLEKAPAARYPGAAALREDLENFLANRPIAARPPSAAGRAWRWARRHPARATAAAAGLLLLLTVALGSSLHAWRLEHERLRTLAERDRATRAEAVAREQLRAALIAQAKAVRHTASIGHRRDALAALQQAAAIRPGLDARGEAIAALSLPEWTPHHHVKAWDVPGLSTATPLPGFAAFIHETEQGVFSRRNYPGGEVVWTWPGRGSPSAGQTVVSPDGRWFAVRLQNDEIHVLDAAAGAPLFTLEGRPFAFKSSRIWGYGVDMAFSPDGARFAATRAEGGVSIHSVPEGRETARWESPAVPVCVGFSPNGRWLAVGGSRQREHNTIALLDAADGRQLAADQPVSRVDFLAWSADNRWLAVGSRPVQVRATADFSIRAVVPDRAALHGHFLPGADRLLLTEQIGQTRLWDIDTGRLVLTKNDSGRPGVWFEGAVPRQWRYFMDGRVDLQTLEPSPVLTVHRPGKTTDFGVPASADPLDFTLDGKWLVLGAWHRPLLVNIASGLSLPLGEPGPAHSVATARLEADGRTLWIGRDNAPLRRHELSFNAQGEPGLSPGEEVPGHDGFLPTALHRPTGRLALTNYRDGLVRILDTRSRQTLAEWPLPRASHVVFSPDGSLVLSNAEPTPDGRAEIREAATGRLVRQFGGAGRIAAWSPDGRQVLVGTGRNETSLLHAGTWTAGPALPADLQSFNLPGSFSPDARWLVLRMNAELHLLRASNLELLARIEMPDSVRYLCALRFTGDGRTLVAVRSDGRIDLWHLDAMRAELARLGLDWPD